MLCAVRALDSAVRGAAPTSLVGSHAAAMVGSQQHATTVQTSAQAPATSEQVAGHRQQFMQQPSLPSVHNMLPTQQQPQQTQQQTQAGQSPYLTDPPTWQLLASASTLRESAWSSVNAGAASVEVAPLVHQFQAEQSPAHPFLAGDGEQSPLAAAGLLSENLLTTGPQQQQQVAQAGAQYYDSGQLASSLWPPSLGPTVLDDDSIPASLDEILNSSSLDFT